MGSCSRKSETKHVIITNGNVASPRNSKQEYSSVSTPISRSSLRHKSPRMYFDFSMSPQEESSTATILNVPKGPADVDLIRSSFIKHFIFNSLKESHLSKIIHSMRLYNFKADELIFHQGQPGLNFYIVSKGKLEIIVNSKHAKVISTGDSFGEMALLHSTLRTASVITKTACSLWCLDGKVFRSMIEAIEVENYEENKAFINCVEIFQILDETQKDLLVHSLSTQSFIPGSVIINKNDAGDFLYIIKEGTVSVTKHKKPVRIMQKGCYFGEQAFLFSSPRSATVTAVDQVKCLAVSGEFLVNIFGTCAKSVILENTIKISIHKNQRMKHLTSFQIDKIKHIAQFKNFDEGEVVVPAGIQCKHSMFVVIRGGLVKGKAKEAVANEFDVINSEGLSETDSKEFGDNLIAAEETTVAIIEKKTFEEVIGCTYEETIENNALLKVLQNVRILKGLSPASMQDIIKAMRVEEFKSGSIIVEQQAPGDAFFIIKSGKATVLKDGINVRTITKHDYFGERSLLFNKFRSATVQAEEPVACWIIKKSEFEEILIEPLKKQLLARIALQDSDVSLNDLCFVKLLNSGSCGNVFLVVHKVTKMLYTLKTVERTKILAYKLQDSLVLERKILFEIDHSFIVKIVKTFKDTERVYFLMEYIQGFDLFNVLREIGLLQDNEAQFYVACLLVILEFLHERGIIYRDLKPENVIVDEGGYLKLIDFGTAKFINCRTYSIVGTPHYMAPEIITGHGYTIAVDYWSLGVVAYEFLYGKEPFGWNETDPLMIYEKIQRRELEFPKWASKNSSAKEFVDQLLDANPTRRIKGGVERIKLSNWLQGIEWDKLAYRLAKPSYLPRVRNMQNEIDSALLGRKSLNESIQKFENKGSQRTSSYSKKSEETWDRDF